MKRIVYLLAILGIVFTGCNPVEDINNDIDDQGNPVVGVEEFTMTSDDYANLVDQGEEEDPDFYEMFNAFSDVDDAKLMLPDFLSDRYPFWGEGSSVTVNYNLFDGNPEDAGAFATADVYNLGSNDYPSANSNAFLPEEDVEMVLEDILTLEFADPTNGQVVRLGYNKFTSQPEIGLASVYEASFPANFTDFEFIEVFDDGLEGMDDNLGWRNQSGFAEGSGFAGGANQTEEWLISEEIDLSNSTGLSFQITQEIDFLGDDTLIDVLVSSDYTTGGDPMTATWTPVVFDKTIFGDMSTSADLDFSAYDGENVHVALKYSSTDSDSPRWRVESFAIRTTGFSGDTEALSAYYKYTEGSWDDIDGVYYLSSADYDSMGESSGQPGQFNNFSDNVLPSNYLPQFLSMQYPFAQEEDEIFVIYRYFTGGSAGTITRGNLYTFTSGEWTPSVATLQLGFKNGVWVPDNTIRYTLTSDDYALIVASLTGVEGFDAAVTNLDSFGNINRAGGSSTWSNDMVVAALNFVLDNLDPNAEQDQKYLVTAATWAPGNSTEDFAVIKDGDSWRAQNDDD